MRVGIYARVSTRDQSCELQLRDLRAYCAARQFVIVHEYIDLGVSGTKDSLPQLNELMADARKRKLDAVLCCRFDRFARSSRHLLIPLEEFRSLGVQFVSYQENLDPSSPLGQAIVSALLTASWPMGLMVSVLMDETARSGSRGKMAWAGVGAGRER